jgi:DNA ligase-1
MATETHAAAASLYRFAQLCEALAATRSRLAKRTLLAEYLHPLDDAEAALAAVLLTGKPFAESDRRTLQVGSAALSRLLAQVTGADQAAAFRKHGDLGAAAFDLLTAGDHAPQPTITLQQLADAFITLSGTSKRAARDAIVLQLLHTMAPLEAKYAIKLMLGDSRTGVKLALVEEAIAAAYGATVSSVRRAVLSTGDVGAALLAARHGTLAEIKPQLFHPLGFMLASPVESAAEAFARHSAGPAATTLLVEDKFDGMRAQAHCQAGRAVLYSRNREDVSASFPELVTAFEQIAGPCILDGEVLGWDPAQQRALPFATFSNRLGRKLVARDLLQTTPVAFLAFDCLFAHGKLLLEEPLSQRREVLAAVLAAERSKPAKPAYEGPQAALFAFAPEVPAVAPAPIMLSPVTAVGTEAELDEAFASARQRGNEGLMIKDPASAYTPGRRGYAWLKMKRELATLDVVITGVEFGHGRRAGILSDYTFAVRDSAGELRNIGKAYSGLTDVEIKQLSDWCMAHTLEDHGHFRTVEPQVILEVAFNNIMRSTRHSSGFALRFPRILRLRPDKLLAEIDTLERAEEIYMSQPDRPVST